MEAVNVFILNGTETFGLLVHPGCTYAGLVEMISKQLRLDMRQSCIKIEYVADVEMSPIRITDDSSLHFYLDLKRKDPRITAYALRIILTELVQTTSSANPRSYDQQNFIQLDTMCDAHILKPVLSVLSPVTHDFISSIEVPALETTDDKLDELAAVTMHPDVGSVRENQIFRDKRVLKNSIALHAIQNNFQYKVYKSDNKEYVLKCLLDNCDWKLRASKIGDTDMFKVRYIKNIHTCSLDNIIRDHRQANSSLIGECVKHKYASARTIYTPVDIMNDMANTYGVTMKYGKAWRAREHALEAVMGDPDQAYERLLLIQICRSNTRIVC